MRARSLTTAMVGLVALMIATSGVSLAATGTVTVPAASVRAAVAGSIQFGTPACTLVTSRLLQKRTITAPGPSGPTSRTYSIYVPSGIRSTSSAPLLVSLHGTGATGATQNLATHWSSFDDSVASAGSPFILVLPDGLNNTWYWGSETSYDATFIFAVIAAVQASGCVNAAQIYVDGWSAGAYMAERMACADGDPAVADQGVVLAGVHSYAGGNPAIPGPPCGPGNNPVRTIPVLMSQGLADTTVNPQTMGFPGFQAWGTRYTCTAPTAPYTLAQQLTGCRLGTAVDWWPINGFTHLTWSCSSDPLWHDRGIWAFLTTRAAPTATTCS